MPRQPLQFEEPEAAPDAMNGSPDSSMAGSTDTSTSAAGAFPDGFAALQRLRYLNLTCCDLERVPPAVAALRQLQELHFCDNRGNGGLFGRQSECAHAFFCLPKHSSNLQVRTANMFASHVCAVRRLSHPMGGYKGA